MTGRTARRRVTRIALDAGQVSDRADLLAAEEPLGIRIGGQAVTLTMRTPGDDVDLAAGFLLTEGIVGSAADIAAIRICSGEQCGHDEHEDDAQDSIGNIADVTLRAGTDWQAPRRNFLATSACGVCGKASIADLRAVSRYDLTADAARVSAGVLAALPGKLRDAQRVFDRTGGLHAAGLFGADGSLQVSREDVGRHNAVDKVARLGAAGRPGPALGLRPPGQRARVVRAGAEGRGGWRAGAGSRLRAVLAGRGAGRRSRPDAGRVPARRLHERVHAPRPRRHHLT